MFITSTVSMCWTKHKVRPEGGARGQVMGVIKI